MTYRLTWLPGVLRSAGLKVAEVPGWADRGHGDMGTPVGIVCHHTGTTGALDKNMPTLDVLIKGRSDLSGRSRSSVSGATVRSTSWRRGFAITPGKDNGKASPAIHA